MAASFPVRVATFSLLDLDYSGPFPRSPHDYVRLHAYFLIERVLAPSDDYKDSFSIHESQRLRLLFRASSPWQHGFLLHDIKPNPSPASKASNVLDGRTRGVYGHHLLKPHNC